MNGDEERIGDGLLGQVEVPQDADQGREGASLLLAEGTLDGVQCGLPQRPAERRTILPPGTEVERRPVGCRSVGCRSVACRAVGCRAVDRSTILRAFPRGLAQPASGYCPAASGRTSMTPRAALGTLAAHETASSTLSASMM